MRRTVLDLTQEILSALDSDEVNSIGDTVESYQVAVLLRGVYYDLATDLGLLEHDTTFGLEASQEPNKPVIMAVPSNVTRVDWIKYNQILEGETMPNYRTVVYKPFNEFLEMMQYLREGQEVDSVDFTGDNNDTFQMIYRTDKFPDYFTTYNNHTIIFDSYRQDIDTTLQRTKCLCYGAVYPEFLLEDTFEPDLDPTQFSLFLNRAKVRAFAELKQTQNAEAAGEARRQKIIVQKRNRTIFDQKEVYKVPRYGRK